MNLEIKVPLSGFLIKWLEVNFGDQPFNFSTNKLLANNIRFIFTGNKGHNKGNLSNKTDQLQARFILNTRQSEAYIKYNSSSELKTAIINHFTTHLYSFVEMNMKANKGRRMELIKEFIFVNQLDGEDITTDYCKKRIKDYTNLKKKNFTQVPEFVPELHPKTHPSF